MTHVLKAVCAVCFNTHTLLPSGLARHGFKIIGLRKGSYGNAWHTGDCRGKHFPNFGVSTKGTLWAIGQMEEQLADAEKFAAKLATRPGLSWSYSTRYPKPSHPAPRTLLDGAKQEYGMQTDWHLVPSYDDEHKSQTRQVESAIKGLNTQLAFYRKAVTDWEPREPAKVPKKAAVVHYERVVTRNERERRFILCGSRSYTVKRTTDKAEVTCQRCCASLASESR